ncbi:putative ABC transport system ATP-binding protein [Pseudarthrobacter equi]|uniref:Putative ABC transport system ATP-binding protein n=1 Tax=Pseudarthrobacter equi TaxID=728066 RepID=A0A1H1VUV0_9MICC|nr:putative ABC transport system ATP-binding protein [Pseudarthrobacter equi]
MQIRLIDLTFSFGSGSPLFENLTHNFHGSTTTGVVGPSGTGKTTLLELIGGKRKPTRGQVMYVPDSVAPLTNRLNPRDISFINQTTPVMPGRTALQNVQVALVSHGVQHRAAERAAHDALAAVGLEGKWHREVSKLSGGEVQRVCVARSLVSPAPIVLADEPTAQLDQLSAKAVSESLTALSRAGKLVIISTHDLMLADACDSILTMGGAE